MISVKTIPNPSLMQQLITKAKQQFILKDPERKMKEKVPTIVVIDDEDSISDIYSILLEREGYRVLTAKNGQVGLDILKNEESSPSLVLVDCSMPHMDGETFLLKMKEDLPQFYLESKVVGFTCFSSSSVFFKRIEALAYDCREKPCNIAGILRLVADYLGMPPNPSTPHSARFAREH